MTSDATVSAPAQMAPPAANSLQAHGAVVQSPTRFAVTITSTVVHLAPNVTRPMDDAP